MHIKLNLKIFIFALFFLMVSEIKIYLCLMAFALFHEMGHMLLGIALGLKPEKLEILPVRFFSIF